MVEKKPSEKKITIAVVDDDVNVRTGLWWLLSNIIDLHCVGTYGSFKEAIQGLALQAPDIVLLDVTLPGVSGLEAIAPLRKQSPHAKIIMHSNYDDEDKIQHARRAGASGYVLKNASAPALYEAIVKVYQGGTVWPAGYSGASAGSALPIAGFFSRHAGKACTLLKKIRRQ